ncbi:MAG: acetyl-CoA carboxylase biotin carboxyl carrier protein [Ignavibacteria bacterium]|jgi:acetyl-CoA carboxylase biotin carboxyl carrier protein
MDLNLIKKLIKIVENSDISDFAVEEGDLKISISKNTVNHNTVTAPQPQVIQSVPQQQATSAAAIETETKEESKEEKTSAENLHEVKSPIVGTFYRAPAPDADPYVKVGDHVSEGTVLCIVEAMKLMNEIESDMGGRIVKILVENATPVEYNQPLFLIEKS